MSSMTAINAFTSVKPRGKDMPSAPAPRKTNHSRAPLEGPIRALDRNGRATVSLSPRTTGAISIESRDASAASVDKRKRISKAGTK